MKEYSRRKYEFTFEGKPQAITYPSGRQLLDFQTKIKTLKDGGQDAEIFDATCDFLVSLGAEKEVLEQLAFADLLEIQAEIAKVKI